MSTGKGEGKTDFVKGVLAKDPRANLKSVNEAWTAGGHEGRISESLVQRIRAELKLTGNNRPRATPAAATGNGAGEAQPSKASRSRKKGGPKPAPAAKRAARAQGAPLQSNGVHTAPAPSPGLAPASDGQGRLLEELETDLDHLIFKVLGKGSLAEIEDGLRRVRRLVVRRLDV